MLKRLARSIFIQGQGSNYRRLTIEEKKTAEENFYKQLNSSSPGLNRIRNFTTFFKELISDAKIPVASKVASEFSLHNESFTDNYAWMSDEKNSQELLNYLILEFNYTEAIMGTKWLQTKDLFSEFRRRLPEYKSQVVSKSGFEYSFQQDRLIRVSNDKEEVVISKQELISHPVLQKNKSLVDYLQNSQFVISNLQFSHDHRFIAVCFPTELSEGLIVKDMSTGMTGFYVENIDNYVVFDNLYGLFYVEKDQETGKGRKVWRKDFGKEKTEDEKVLEETRINIAGKPSVYAELVYEEPDPNFSVEVSQSLSKEYVFIKSDNLSYDPFLISTEFRFRASNKTQGDFLIIQERKEGQNYDVKHQGQYFYLLVSTPEEYNGKVLILDIPPLSSYYPPDGPVIFAETKELQHEFLGAKVFRPHNSQVYIEHVEAFKDHLVSILIDTDNSMQHIQVDNFLNESTDIVAYDKYEGSLKVANNKSYRIKLDQTDQEFYGQSFNYILSTLHCPDQKISYDLKTRMNKVLSYSYEVPEVRIQDYTSERIVLPANDGELIPVTLIYNKRNVATGDKAAAIVESYGGEVENSHNFKLNPFWYSVLDRGFLWVIPHVRGSHDITRTWYDRGSGTNKIRHLQDLLDTIVSLYSEKIVSSASGYSTTPSGGLSFAALMQKEPELLSCAVLRNPLLDIFEYTRDKRKMTEFGDMRDLEVFKTIRSYNPYYQNFPKEFSPLMLCADYDNPLAFQSMKFLAKSREQAKSATVIYKEYPTWTTEEAKRCEEFIFLIENTKVRNKKIKT